MIGYDTKSMFDGVCFTMDLDWASENVVKKTLDFFINRGICPTVFITHYSECAFQYAAKGKVDLGIHPNFIQPSSQGNSIDEIIQYCMNLLPNSKVFRCHRWFASNDVYDCLYQKGLRYESNLCTMMDVIPPFYHRSGMISFPTFFEDGAWLYHNENLCLKDDIDLFNVEGLKVFDIHPMHFVINTPYFRYMRDIKDALPRDKWNNLTEEDIISMTNYNMPGIGDFIRDLIEYYQRKKINFYTLKQVYESFSIDR